MQKEHIVKSYPNGDLYHYSEVVNGKILSYYNVEDNKLIRFDKATESKYLIIFKSIIKLEHTVLGGESFIHVIDATTNANIQYDNNYIIKQVKLINNEITTFTVSSDIIKTWSQTIT
jgi:hypothetical protein